MQTAPADISFGSFAAPRAQNPGILTYLRTGALAVWLFTLIVRYWWLSDWFALQKEFESGANIKLYYLAGFVVALAANLTIGVNALLALPFQVVSTWSGRLFSIFCLLALLISPISLSPRASAMYAVATWGVIALLCLYWENDYRVVKRMIVFAGLIVLGWMYIIFLKHGLTFGSGGGNIGGMNRNTTALAALGGAVCCMMSSNKWLRWCAIAAAGLIAVMVTSRGTIVATGAFLFTYNFIYKGTAKFAAYGFGLMLTLIVVFIVSPPARDLVLEDVMRLHDQSRGIGSGFTGRVEYWKQALEAFWLKPVFGYGFRSTAAGGVSAGYGAIHSGYLKILVETGIVGGFLVISAVVVEFVRRLRLAMQFRDLRPGTVRGIDVVETARVNTLACATIALSLTMWVYEQLYINLGSVISVVFFLMLMAPAYITTQGTGLRR
jgi:hypothetical protein